MKNPRFNGLKFPDVSKPETLEKRYMSSWKSNGLDSPITYKNKSKLNSAIAKFERSTGLKWPFK